MAYNKKEKLQGNIEAIKTAFRVSGTGSLSVEDREKLLRYSGFGAMKFILNPVTLSKEDWSKSDRPYYDLTQELYDIIKSNAYNPAGYLSSVRNSVLTSFYTPEPIVQSIVNVITSNVGNGINFLEPSAGRGVFIDKFKESGRDVNVTAFEKDLLTGKVLSALNPDSDIHVEGFEKIGTHLNGTFDVVSSNIPFGNFKIFDASFDKGDAAHRLSTSKIHNYFFLKALDMAREGGIVAFITSRGVLDSKEGRVIRESMMNNSDLVAAVRLPDGMFSEEAGTEVGSDLIILQKHTKKTTLTESEQHFIDVTEKVHPETGERYDVNRYIHEHDMHIADRVIPGNDPYGKACDNYIFEGNVRNLASNLTTFLQGAFLLNFSQRLYDTEKPVQQESEKPSLRTKTKNQPKVQSASPVQLSLFDLFDAQENEEENNLPREYSGDIDFFYRDGIIVSDGGQLGVLSNVSHGVPMFTPQDYGSRGFQMLMKYIAIRDSYERLYASEAEDQVERPDLRGLLNRHYDQFVSTYGSLNSRKNQGTILLDVKGRDLLSIEVPDSEGKSFIKSDIFHRPVNIFSEITEADNVNDALAASLNTTGGVDWQYMEDLTGRTREDMRKELGDRIYYNADGEYEIAEKFLSGNIVAKINSFPALLSEDEGYDVDEVRHSIQALEGVMPARINFEDLDLNFGERWIPVKYFEEFASALYETPVSIKYAQNLDSFSVRANENTPKISSEYCVNGENSTINGVELLRHALYNTVPEIKKVIGYDSDGKSIYGTDHERVQYAASKIEQIRNEFENWVNGHDSVWKESLADRYNSKFNCFVRAKYDGSHQTFPGLDLKALSASKYGINEVYQSQKDCVWMLVQNGGGICDHEVGTGKTLIMCMAAHEMKRLGVAHKPIIIGMKANVAEIAATYQTAYPGDRILYASRKDFSDRKSFFGRMKNNDYDCIIMSHDQFSMIPQSLEIQRDVMQDELEALDQALEVFTENGDVSKKLLVGLEKRKENLVANLSQINNSINTRTDDIVDFETMGIDHIFVDESQVFKNLPFTTRDNRVSGIGNPIGSQRARNLQYAIRTIQKRSGKDLGATFLSGTTISNSLTELYLLFSYLRPNALAAQDIRSFDAWSAVFARKSRDYELNVAGQVTMKERFRYFIKTPELAAFYNEITDYRTAQDVGVERPDMTVNLVSIPPTPAHEDINKRLLEFAKSPSPELIFRTELSDRDLKAKMLIVTNTGKNASLSPRLVHPDYEEGEGTKIGVAAKNIAAYYERFNEQKGTQFVFCDRSTWKKGEWNAYGELRDRLVNDYGIPSDEIAFIQDAGTSEAKRKDFIKKMNEGVIRILFGSTATLGTGVNAQQRAVAIHHLDLPWKPSDLEQRNGRARRKGNEVAKLYANNNVDVLIYAVEKSLDSYNFYLLQAKSEFISQLKNGNLGKRSFDQGGDSEEDGMPFAEYVAITSGNTDLLDRAKLEKKILALESEKKVFFQERSKVQRDLVNMRSVLADRKEKLPKYEKDAVRLASVSQKDDNGIYIADFKPFDELIPKDKLKNGILEEIDKGAILQDQARRLITEETQIGTVNGFPVYIRPNTEEKDKGNILVIGGEVHYRYGSGHINLGSRLLALKIIGDTINMIPSLIERTKENISSAEKKIPELERISSKEWSKTEELSQLKKEMSELDRKIQHDMDDAVKTPEGEKEKPYTIEEEHGRYHWRLRYPLSVYPFVTKQELNDLTDKYQGYLYISPSGEFLGSFKHKFAAEEVALNIGMLNAEHMKDKDWLINHGVTGDLKPLALASIRRLSQMGYDRYGRDIYLTQSEPSTVYAFGEYSDVRDLSHRVKERDKNCMRLTATAIAQAIEQLGLQGKSYILPMPSYSEKNMDSFTKDIARLLNINYNIPVQDYLEELNKDEYSSMYEWKKEHTLDHLPEVYFKSGIHDEEKVKGLTPIIIDNVFDTGTTASAAVSALKEKPVFIVLGTTGNHDANKFNVQKIANGMSIIEKLRPEGVGFTGYQQEAINRALEDITSSDWKIRYEASKIFEKAGLDKYTGQEHHLIAKYYAEESSSSKTSSREVRDAMLSGEIRRFTEEESKLLPPVLYRIHDELYVKASNASYIDYRHGEHLHVLSAYLNDLVSERKQAITEDNNNENTEFMDVTEKTNDQSRMVNLAGDMENAAELEEQLLADVREIIEDNDLSDEVNVTRVRIYGSRADVYSSPESDLDVLVEYDSDSWREYALFDLLHEEEHTLRGVHIDFNPISLSKTGTIEEYLDQPHVKSYVFMQQEEYKRKHGEVRNMKVVPSAGISSEEKYFSGERHDIDISLREALIMRMRNAGINIVEDKELAQAALAVGSKHETNGHDEVRQSKVTDNYSGMTDNKRTFFETCDEAERQVKARGFDNGYAYDLGIGPGEYTYDQGDEDAFFEFIDRDFQHFGASYYGLINEVEFTFKSAGLNSGTYEVTKEEWQRRLSESLQKVDNQNAENNRKTLATVTYGDNVQMKELTADTQLVSSTDDNTIRRDLLARPISQQEIDTAKESSLLKSWSKYNVPNSGARILGPVSPMLRTLAKACLGIDSKYDITSLFRNPYDFIGSIVDIAKEIGLKGAVAEKIDWENKEQVHEVIRNVNEKGEQVYTASEVDEICRHLTKPLADQFRECIYVASQEKNIQDEIKRITAYNNGAAVSQAFVLYDIATRRMREQYGHYENDYYMKNYVLVTPDGERHHNPGWNTPEDVRLKENEAIGENDRIETEYSLRSMVSESLLTAIATMPVVQEILGVENKNEGIESQNFKNWFGDWQNDSENASKVVSWNEENERVEPTVVYHGTTKGFFPVFDKDMIGSSWNADDEGFFFTESKSIAENYTRRPSHLSQWGVEGKPHLFDVYLDIKNPLVIDKKWYAANYNNRRISDHDAIEIWDDNREDILEAKKNGNYDGIIIDTTGYGARQPKMYVVFEPEQIKSASLNNGQWRRDNADIRYFKTNDGDHVYGFVKGDTIYIDPAIATAETPLHEYSHLWASAMRQSNPSEWRNIVELMKNSPEIWNKVRHDYPELKDDDAIADEVLAQYSGKRGYENLINAAMTESGTKEPEGIIAGILSALEKFWASVSSFLNLHYTSKEQVADQILRDALSGVNPLEYMDQSKEIQLAREIKEFLHSGKDVFIPSALSEDYEKMTSAFVSKYKSYTGIRADRLWDKNELRSRLSELTERYSTNKAVFTGLFVQDKDFLWEKVTPVHENIYDSHITTSWRPEAVDTLSLGAEGTLHVRGRLITSDADILLLKEDFGDIVGTPLMESIIGSSGVKTSRDIPHITISMRPGVYPRQSNDIVGEYAELLEMKSRYEDSIIPSEEALSGMDKVLHRMGITTDKMQKAIADRGLHDQSLRQINENLSSFRYEPLDLEIKVKSGAFMRGGKVAYSVEDVFPHTLVNNEESYKKNVNQQENSIKFMKFVNTGKEMQNESYESSANIELDKVIRTALSARFGNKEVDDILQHRDYTYQNTVSGDATGKPVKITVNNLSSNVVDDIFIVKSVFGEDVIDNETVRDLASLELRNIMAHSSSILARRDSEDNVLTHAVKYYADVLMNIVKNDDSAEARKVLEAYHPYNEIKERYHEAVEMLHDEDGFHLTDLGYRDRWDIERTSSLEEMRDYDTREIEKALIDYLYLNNRNRSLIDSPHVSSTDNTVSFAGKVGEADNLIQEAIDSIPRSEFKVYEDYLIADSLDDGEYHPNEQDIMDEIVSKLGEVGVKVETDIEVGKSILKEQLGIGDDGEKVLRTADGERVIGFAYDGVVYLDRSVATVETPLHEYTHLWAESIRQCAPEKWNRIVKIMKGDDAADLKEVLKDYPELHAGGEINDDVIEEALARYSGRYGRQKLLEDSEKTEGEQTVIVPQTFVEKVTAALHEFWKSVQDILGITEKRPFVGDNIREARTASDIADIILSDLYNDKHLPHVVSVSESPRFQKAISNVNKVTWNGSLDVYSSNSFIPVRHMSLAVKKGDESAIKKAGDILTRIVERIPGHADAVLVPIPNRSGKAEYTLRMAEEISKKTGLAVADILTGTPHKPIYEKKGDNGNDGLHLMRYDTKGELPEGKTAILVDNVLDTGTTAMSALRTLGENSKLVVLGSTKNFRKYNYPVSVHISPVITDAFTKSRAADIKARVESTYHQLFRDNGLGYDIHNTVRNHDVSSWQDAESLARKLSLILMFQRPVNESENAQVHEHAHSVMTGIYHSETRDRLIRDASEQFGDKAAKAVEGKLDTNGNQCTEQEFKEKLVDIMEDMDKYLLYNHLENVGRTHEIFRLSEHSPAPSAAVILDGDTVRIELGSVSSLTSGQGTQSFDSLDASSKESVMSQLLSTTSAIKQKTLYIDNYTLTVPSTINIQSTTKQESMVQSEHNENDNSGEKNIFPQWTPALSKELDHLRWEPSEKNDNRIAELESMRDDYYEFLATIKEAKETAASNEGRKKYYIALTDSFGQRDGTFAELWLKPEDIKDNHYRSHMLHESTFGDEDIPNQGVVITNYHPELERKIDAKEFIAYDLYPVGSVVENTKSAVSEEEAKKYISVDYDGAFDGKNLEGYNITSVLKDENYNIRVINMPENYPSPDIAYASFYAPAEDRDLAVFEVKPLVEYANAKVLNAYIDEHRDKSNPESLGFAMENNTTGARWEVYPVLPVEGGRKNTFTIWTNEDSFKSGEMTGLRGNGWSAEAVTNKLSEVRARWIKDSESQTANVKLWDIKGAVPTQEVRTAINAPVPTVEQQSSRMEKYLSVKETIVAAVDKLGADSGIKLEISDYDDEYNLSVTTGSGERFYAKYEKSPSDISLYEKGHEGTSTEEVTASEWQDAVLEAITRQESLSVKEEQSHAEEKPAVVIENAKVIRQTKGDDAGKWSILATVNGEQHIKPLAYKDREAYFAKDKEGRMTHEVTPAMLAEKYFSDITSISKDTLVVSEGDENVTASKKFENVVFLRDETGKYAMFAKPEGEKGYAVYPSNDDLSKFFEAVNSGDLNKKEEVKTVLAEKYMIELEKDPSIKADIFHEDIGSEVLALVSSVKTSRDKESNKATIVATINGQQQEPRSISASQWQRVWLSSDRNAYNKRLAAVVYDDIINKHVEKSQGVTAVDILSDALEKASKDDSILVNADSKSAPHIYGKSSSLPVMTSLLLAMHSDRYDYSTNTYTHIYEAKQRQEHVKQGNKGFEVAMTAWDTYQSKTDASKLITRQEYKNLSSEEKKGYVAQPSEVPHKLFNIDQTTMKSQNEVAYNTEVSERGILPERINAGNVPEDNKTMLDVNKFILSVRDNLVPIEKGEDVKGYDKDSDKIVIPGIDKYGDYESYAQDIFRFTVEATGHEGRLNRVASVAGSEKEGIDSAHAHEQLVVELASAIKMLDLGLPARISEGNKALIPIWQENLRNNETYLNLVSSDVTSALAMISQAERGKKVENKKDTVSDAQETSESVTESQSENVVPFEEPKLDNHASMILSALSGASENHGIWLNGDRKSAPSFYRNEEYVINPFNSMVMALHSDINEYKTNAYTSFFEAKKNGFSVKGHEASLEYNWLSWNSYVNKYDKHDTISKETYDKLPKEEQGFYRAVATKEKRCIYNVDQTILKHSNEAEYNRLVKDNTTSSLAEDYERSKDQEAFALSDKLSSKHSGALILIRMNNRYCGFGENAEKLSEVLHLEKQPLPELSEDKEKAVKVCFDSTELDRYLPMLIRAGHRAALCDFVPSAIRTVGKDAAKVFEKIDKLGEELKKMDRGVSVTKARNTSFTDGKLTICTNRQSALHAEYETAIKRLNDNYRNVILYTGTPERLGRINRSDILPEDLSKYNRLVSELAAGVLMLREGFPARLQSATMEDVKYWEREFKEDPRLLARIENDVNNAVEVVIKIQEGNGQSIDFAKLRGEKYGQILNPNDYVISRELANHPSIEAKNIVLVKDVKGKSVDVILPEGASLKMGEDISGMNKNRIARALEKEGFPVENISWYNASGSHALNQPDEYFKGKTVEVSRLKQYTLTLLTRLDFSKDLANINQVGIADVRMIRDDAGKWAMYVKPDSPLKPFAIYPENKDATKLFVALKLGDAEGLQAVKEELGRHYVNVVANHPDLKADFLMPSVPEGVDVEKIEKVHVFTSKDTGNTLIMPTVDGHHLQPKEITQLQFDRMWLAGDMKEYKTALAAVLYKEELTKAVGTNVSASQQGESEKGSQNVEEDSPRKVSGESAEHEQRRPGFKAGR